ncbi:TPR repeat-containing protein [Mesotoga sp. Brook.08.YT.4.2.5.1]|uniref:tetratricopeptide repeat protein n=1 Tax=unclassified Mesotoga TaxID=1184398 RepID=UPI000C188C64|nr:MULTISPECIES: tetratricopeptide repeat protein [unclassified Mesotoga]RAM59046.1 hypothetical protein DS65_01045 [Mesotoga sp. SC_4PWL113PWK15]PNE22622.1 TPR repeat-containing protein [Mesotoga sp. Brook.08.YT.4.2.5.1]PVD16086.1 hypothetical protein V512_003945 [Mesotoga sp. Brook.08.105.5.1]RAO95765.1 hypothetical protein M388_04535 [Mesotoga sp. Brook.08.YT.4.2.5.4.]RDI94130.1 hypothetical protein Q502_01230 [Mesotoga sp. Brook.08.YT.4.2.5.2.]
MKDKTVLIYLPIKPEMAKANNLPVKLPVLAEDLEKIADRDRIELDIIIRGLEAQCKIERDDYYESYLLYYYFEAFKRALNSGAIGESKEYLDKAGKIKKDYRYHFYRGLMFREEARTELAEIELRRSIEMNDEFYIGYFELGRLLQSQEEFDDAIASYLKSIEVSGGQFALPFVAVIDCFISKGEYNEALEIAGKIGKGFPLYSDILLRKGVILNEVQKFALAEETFTESIGSNEDWRSFYNRSFSKARQGKLYEAYEDLKTAYAISGNPDVLYELAINEKNMGMLEDSLSHCRSYYNNTADQKALMFESRVLDMMGEYDVALELLDDTYLELKTLLLLHKYLSEGVIERELVFENTLNESYYRYLRGRFLSKDFSTCNLIESGKINVESLTGLLSELDNAEVTKRISAFSEGTIPKEIREITLAEMGFFTELISLLEAYPSQQEYLSYLMAFLISGSGKTTGIFRTLLYVQRWVLSGLPFRTDSFIDEYLEELKDLSFDFALRIAKLSEYGGTDVDTLEEEANENPEEVTLAILCALEKGTVSEIKTNNDSLGKYIMRLSRSGGE